MKNRLQIELRPGSALLLAAGILFLPIHWLISVIISASLHEVGHLWMLTLRRVPIHAVVIGSTGARIRTGPLSNSDQFLCSLAGPAAGLLASWLFRGFPVARFCCLVHSLFNLLPFTGFDGGRVLESACAMAFGETGAHKICFVLRLLFFFGSALFLLTFFSKMLN